MEVHSINWRVVAGLLLGLFVLAISVAAGRSSVARAEGRREKAFIRRAGFFTAGLVLVFILCLFYLPSPYKWFTTVNFLLLVPLSIRRWSPRLLLLQRADEREKRSELLNSPKSS